MIPILLVAACCAVPLLGALYIAVTERRRPEKSASLTQDGAEMGMLPQNRDPVDR
jgi:hypothetical protein